MFLNDATVIELDDIGKKNPNVETLKDLAGAHNWLKGVYNSKPNNLDYDTAIKISESIDEMSVNILPDSIVSDAIDATHESLIHYIFVAWSKELGVVLSPDMIFYTIISEIKNFMIKNPKIFQTDGSNVNLKSLIVNSIFLFSLINSAIVVALSWSKSLK